MKQIIAIVKPFRAQDVLEAIGEFNVDSVLVGEAAGFGQQRDAAPRLTESEYDFAHIPKIEITLFVQDDLAEQVVDRIVEVARTGRIGDGKILVFPVVGDVDF
ncbi:Nitrogen regulatory protein P-II [Planctomycetes bacterium Pan216]|uniref:Nitrogen regulatory protein P-II n=1 Tax=Kolteria novifilia TaxID=2527975 RepID=A0A518B0Y6_9BACT|nr:Nitrogen regulatory protein P-II [Planctomycetes bacterium Pan216]